MKRWLKRLFSSREKVFDAAVDLSLDVLLIIIDVLSAPIVLPARLAAHALKRLAKMIATREARKTMKAQITKRLGAHASDVAISETIQASSSAEAMPKRSATSANVGSEA